MEPARVIQVQFQNVTDAGPEQFKSTRTQVVVAPSDCVSGEFVYPYSPGPTPGGAAEVF
jgi:hypothetical protein